LRLRGKVCEIAGYNDSVPIRLLSAEVSSQIAAGEVVERPASVVKELLENALDARAHGISISVGAAGRSLIEVADDGFGIAANELALAVSRHATSKLGSAEDLAHIATLGFRGEALASIGAISRLTLTTKEPGSPQGARLRVEGGHAGSVETVGASTGTVVRVEDLFYNVPARLKFLKTDVTERRAIDTLVTRYSLAYANVRFNLVHDGKAALGTTGDGDRRAILAALYGVDVARQMLEISAEDDGQRISGYVSPVALTRSSRREISIFINGRWVQDTPLTSAVVQAYHTLLMVGRFPLAALFIEMAPEDVDVNVHPAKSEVRIRNHDRVHGFTQRAVRRGLLAYAPVPEVQTRAWATPANNIDPTWELAHADRPADADTRLESAPPSPENSHLPLLRVIGQIGATYVVAEGPDGLYLVDQHAAHERILFEKLMSQHHAKDVASQALLRPATITLPAPAAAMLASQLPVLRHLGFAVEEFGPNSYQLRAVPVLFADGDPTAALQAAVEDFEEDERPLQNQVEARLAARVCKRMAIKAGRVLAPEEQRALLADLERCESPRTCPHGRPTMIHLSVDMLERQFGRQGAR
jgi:DNA mismatch repair protein MutL